ncbi:hypothetical protein GBA52_026208 [Prunus armeniaca]|nr:hypothetical protein GBA52_026208 [Prunus armeniaca]
MGKPAPPPPPPSSPPLPPSPSPPPPPVGDRACENEFNLRHVLDQFTQTVTTALQGTHNTEVTNIKRVKELGAHEFFGSADPTEAENWLMDIKRVFEVLQCPDGDRVRGTPIISGRLSVEGSMSMLEYEHKFNELSRFAPELISTEEEKCRRFKEGLWLDIQAVVTATTYPTMKALA